MAWANDTQGWVKTLKRTSHTSRVFLSPFLPFPMLIFLFLVLLFYYFKYVSLKQVRDTKNIEDSSSQLISWAFSKYYLKKCVENTIS